jgi:hypothetical protein
MSEEFKFGQDHTKCPTCGYCAHAHEENPKLKAYCESLKGMNPMEQKAHQMQTLIDALKGKKGNPFTMSNAEFVKSLKTLYLPGQVRAVNPESIKFQGEGSMELEVYADSKIVEWLKKQPATKGSVAGTGVMYTPCQLVAHDKADPKVAGFAGPVRVQINGPALNRDWGAEFVVDHPKLRAWAEQFAYYLKAKEAPKGQTLLDEETKDDEPEEEDKD